MTTFLKQTLLGLLIILSSKAQAQIFNSVRVFYTYTYNNSSGESRLYQLNVEKEVVELQNTEFFSHLKNTNEEFDITTYQLDISKCKGDNCTIRASIFSPKLGNISTQKTYSRRSHKKFELILEDRLGSLFIVMSATSWKGYAKRHQINFEVDGLALVPGSCEKQEYCYTFKP